MFVPDSCLVDEAARDPVAAAAARRPDGLALITGVTSLTWSDVDRQVTAAAHRIAALAPPGERVAIVLGNSIEFVATYFGVLRAGRVAVPLNPAYTADELDFAITDSRAAVVVAGQAGQERLRSSAPTRVHPNFDLDLAAPAEGLPPVSAGELAVLLYTSGRAGGRRARCSPTRRWRPTTTSSTRSTRRWSARTTSCCSPCPSSTPTG